MDKNKCLPIKIGEENESLFNNMIYSIVKIITPPMRSINLIPNDVTTISLYFAYEAYKRLIDKDILCMLYYLIYVILDYADGYMARKYKLYSNFGDKYDHIRDYILHIALFSIIYKDYKLVIIFILGLLLSFSSFGCQEVFHENICNETNNGSIGWMKPFCIRNNKMVDTYNKYIGSGSCYVGPLIVMYLYCKK